MLGDGVLIKQFQAQLTRNHGLLIRTGANNFFSLLSHWTTIAANNKQQQQEAAFTGGRKPQLVEMLLSARLSCIPIFSSKWLCAVQQIVGRWLHDIQSYINYYCNCKGNHILSGLIDMCVLCILPALINK